MTQDQSGYPAYYAGQCGVSSEATCIADCVAKASCADLAAFPAADPEDGSCPDGLDATQMCASACFEPEGCITPLVLSFGGGPVRFERSARGFDMAIGRSVATDWPSAETPWLAMDRNGNGTIDDASELFGSSSRLAGGGRAPNGFVALRELDSNGDGRITPADEGWSKLLVWSDRDGDRVSSAGELASLDHFGIVSIDLDYGRVPRCDARGNCEVERARFRYRDASEVEREGEVIDVHLRVQTE